MTPSPHLSLIVFAFNEADNIPSVLEELCAWLRAQSFTSEIIFVDDGSSDESQTRAQRALQGFPHKIIAHPTNRGIGAAIKSGMKESAGTWGTFMPADGQIAPDAIGTLLSAADEDTDLVFSTYLDRDDGSYRKVLSWGMRTLVHVVHGVAIRSDGPYLVRPATFLKEPIPTDSFFLNLEFPIRALNAGLRTKEVQISCRPRISGRSKSAGVKQIVRITSDLFELRLRRFRENLKGRRS